MPTRAQLAQRRALVAAARKRHPPRAVPPAQLPRPTAYTKALSTVAEALNDALSAELTDALGVRLDAAEGGVPEFNRGDVLRRLQQLAERVVKRQGSLIDRAIDACAETVASKSKIEWAKQAQAAVGVDLSKVEPNLAPVMEHFRRENLDLITSMAKSKVERVKAILDDAPNARVETIRDRLMEEHGVTKRQAALIARDQVLSLNAQVTQKRHEAAGVSRYIWRTSGDGAVRPAHAKLNGKVFSYDDPPVVDPKSGRRENPGEDYQCRCTAEPVIEGFDAAEEPAQPTAPRPTTEAPPSNRAPRVRYDKPPPPVPAAQEDVPQRTTRALSNDVAASFEAMPVERKVQGVALRDHGAAAVQYPSNRVGDEGFARHVEEVTSAALAEASPDDAKALARFTGPAYGRVNLYLREGEAAAAKRYGKKALADVQEIIEGTDRALAVLPRAPADMTLFRGITLKDPAELDAFARASVVDQPSFGSSSRDPKVALGFGGGESDEPSVIYRIRKHSTGRMLPASASNTSESEVLFPRGARFRVVGRQRVSETRLLLDVEEVTE